MSAIPEIVKTADGIGIVVICCYCLKVKTEEGAWLESFDTVDRTLISHGMCPDCFENAMRAFSQADWDAE